MRERLQELDKISFIDLESSGLHRSSFPIEVGFADGALKTVSWLIRPHSSWGKDDWSLESQKVHGIEWDALFQHGIDVVETANRLNEEFGGRVVFSDAPTYDGAWLLRLFAAAEITPAFKIGHVNYAFTSLLGDGQDAESSYHRVVGVIDRTFPHDHRAGSDAKRLAAIWKGLSEPEWLTTFEAEHTNV